MSIDPIKTYQEISNSYGEYLRSLFSFRDEELYRAAQALLKDGGQFVRGPFVEATMPFKAGHTLSEMVENGLLSSYMEKAFSGTDYSKIHRYVHQEQAINKLNSGRNIIVATGTGSGKTECFLIPILNALMREQEAGTLTPGVRALLLYPMNALANDQMDRLRDCLKDLPFITFGRYIGETEEERPKALERFKESHPGMNPLPNELLSRGEMRSKPPHILVTNYAMLEYLLLRPQDNDLFEGVYSGHYHFLVLDEAHTYKGAHGAEVSMLLRRLKERALDENQHLLCVATSATLGRGTEDFASICDFATALFSEPFAEQDVVIAEREELKDPQGSVRAPSFYEDLHKLVVSGAESDELLNFAGIRNSQRMTWGQALYLILSQDPLMYRLRRELVEAVCEYGNLAEKLFASQKNSPSETRYDLLAKLIDMGAKARLSDDAAPLLAAKYHVFARALEGAFVSLFPKKALFLDRRTEFDGHPVYELANCIRCGQEHLLGRIEPDGDGYEHLVPAEKECEFFLLGAERLQQLEEDEDEWDESIRGAINEDEYELCTACGAVNPVGAMNRGQCCHYPLEKLVLITRTKESTCLACGRNRTKTIQRLLGNDDASTEVLARKLYHALPMEPRGENKNTKSNEWDYFSEPSTSANDELFDEHGHKLLMFSDSRQEAAFAAVFLQNRYNDWLWRHIILTVLENAQDESGLSYRDVLQRMIKAAEKHRIFSNNDTLGEKRAIAGTQLMKEIIEMEPRIGLHGLGLIDIWPDIPTFKPALYSKIASLLHISERDAKKIYPIMFDTLRRQGAVTFPDDVNPQDEAFAPRNRRVRFRSCGSEDKPGLEIIGWLSQRPGASNRRQDYCKRLLKRVGVPDEDCDRIARETLQFLFNIEQDIPRIFKDQGIIDIDGKNNTYSLNLGIWRIRANDTELYRCDKCNAITQYNLHGVCPEYRCDGTLTSYSHNEQTRYRYYMREYTEMKSIPLCVEEHTAQLSSQRASELQNLFKKNDVNILSCSTTFEMGVDIGSLEGVLLRNVPPETSNYVQRAGRAGRRVSAAAFILTYARRRSHDLTFYIEPEKMIRGIIRPPHIDQQNENIIRRHIHSTVLAWFFRKERSYFGRAIALLGQDNQPPVNEALEEAIKQNPTDLLRSLKRIVPAATQEVFDLDGWGWLVGFLCQKADSQNPPVLIKALEEFKSLLDDLDEIINQCTQERQFNQAAYLEKMRQHFSDTDTIGFLSRGGVIPRYGFPVDSVSLEILHHGEDASRLQLDRDLSLAITDYAPGTKVIAGGKLWVPYAAKTLRGRVWPTFHYAICHECSRIYQYPTSLGQEAAERETVCCGHRLKYAHFIVPVYGFTTQRNEPPARAGDKRPLRYYATEIYFDGKENGEIITQDIPLPSGFVSTRYAQHGGLTLVNKGQFNKGFLICPWCGYMQEAGTGRVRSHNTPTGRPCSGTLQLTHLGHQYQSNTLRITLPGSKLSEEVWLSILYAIIEGACNILDIDRREIGGCLWWSGGIEKAPSLILYDTVPGGAGHVRKVQQNLVEVLVSAANRVDGRCGCSEETSCYGCLRNYGNQRDHEVLRRGAAKKYLSALYS